MSRALSTLAVPFALLMGLAPGCVGDDVNPNADAGSSPDSSAAGADATNGDSASGGDANSSDASQDASADAEGDAFVPDDAGSPGGVGNFTVWFTGDTGVVPSDAGVGIAAWKARAGMPLTLVAIPGASLPYASTINGHPSIHFDGHAGNQPCPCPGLQTTLSAPMPQPLTIFAVVKADRYTDGSFNYEGTVLTNYPPTFKLGGTIQPGPSLTWALNAGTKLTSAAFSNVDWVKPRVLTAIYNAGTSIMRVDGNDATAQTGAGGSSPLATSFILGNDGNPLNSLQGDVGELVVYGRVLTTQERSAVETSLKAKWNIP